MAWLRSMTWITSCALTASSAFAAGSHTISVHVLDQTHGRPAPMVGVTLEEKAPKGETWNVVARAATDDHGRIASLLPKDQPLHKGIYRVTFATGDWYAAHGKPTFFPSVTVTFQVDDAAQNYHIPLLLSPFGYATYRGN